jgi:putative ABC transport system permease protein
MSWWNNLSGGLRALLEKRRAEQEMDEELRGYRQASEEQKMASGMTAEEARRAARVEMGSLEAVKDEIRGTGWEAAVEALGRDVRYALRVLGKAPVFTAVVVGTLALGIGANTAIFSLLDAILLRSLPVEKPEELVQFGQAGNSASFTNPLWEQVRDQQDVFSGVFAWGPRDSFNLSRGGAVDNANGLWVSGDYFRTLGLRPAAGRLFSAADDRRGCAALAVLSHSFWEERYGGAAAAVGSSISLNGQSFRIVGVAPAGFYGMDVGSRFDVAIPICAAPVFDGPKSRLDQRSWWWLRVAGRRKPGMEWARLKARLAVLSPQVFGAAVPETWGSKAQEKFRQRLLEPLPAARGASGLRARFQRPLAVLMGIVGLVLLIACANIASLLVARAAARAKEMALRQALGASRWRLIRQLLVECLLLSAAGAAVGMAVARWGDLLLVRYLSTLRSKVFLDFSPDGRVLAFTAGIAVLTGLLFGVIPAFRGTRVSLADTIKEGSLSQRGSRGGLRLWIAGLQVALSLVLVVTAGLLLRSFGKLATLDLGFDRNQVLLVTTNLTKTDLPVAESAVLFNEIESRLRALPGVEAVSRSWGTPLSGFEWNNVIRSDVANAPAGDDALVYFNWVSPTYFETMRTPLMAGRNFNAADTAKAPKVAVINQTLARRFFAGVNPVGRTFRVNNSAGVPGLPVEVVGIVKDAKYESPREDTYATAFFPVTQQGPSGSSYYELRTPLAAAALRPAIEQAVGGVNKEIPIEMHSLATQVDDTMTSERLLAALSAFFGGLALLLAMVGLYGTLAYLVRERRVEFGIRMALGARPGTILTLAMRDVLSLLAVGTAGGLAISLGTSRLLRTLLFGLEPRDPVTMAMAAVLLAAVSLAASYLAARRATKVDPIVALRHE